MWVEQKPIPAYTVQFEAQISSKVTEMEAGSPTSFVSEDMIPNNEIDKSEAWKTFNGINRAVMSVKGRINIEMKLISCNAMLNINFHVVPCKMLPYPTRARFCNATRYRDNTWRYF